MSEKEMKEYFAFVDKRLIEIGEVVNEPDASDTTQELYAIYQMLWRIFEHLTKAGGNYGKRESIPQKAGSKGT